MTTPAHCTRTDPHNPHWWDDHGLPGCPGVEPPADVQATPDPRLDVVTECPTRWRAKGASRCERHADGWHHCDGTEHAFGGHECVCGHDMPDAFRSWLGTSSSETYTPPIPAPAGLTPAQEIRLRVYEGWITPADRTADQWAAWVEHGDDETPASRWEQRALRIAAGRDAAEARANLAEYRIGLVLRVLDRAGDEAPGIDAEIRRILAGDEIPDADCPHPALHREPGVKRLYEAAAEAHAAAAKAETRADLAEARLGHIADALRDLPYEWRLNDLVEAVGDALAWTPDDTGPSGKGGE